MAFFFRGSTPLWSRTEKRTASFRLFSFYFTAVCMFLAFSVLARYCHEKWEGSWDVWCWWERALFIVGFAGVLFSLKMGILLAARVFVLLCWV